MDFQNKQSDDNHLISLLEDAIDFAIYRITVDPSEPYGGKVSMVSPSLKEIVGIEDPWRFSSWFQNIHPDDLPRVVEANRRAWNERVVYDQSTRIYNDRKGQWIWVHTISTPITDSQGNLTHFTGIVLDITKQKQAEQEIDYRARFENLILNLSTHFINLAPDEVDPAISTALQAIGQFTEVDRAYVFAYDHKEGTMRCTHEWCQPGISQEMDHLQNLPIQSLSWSNTIILGGETLQIPDIDALPWNAVNEKKEFQAQGIRSLLAVPMIYQGAVSGLLGFDAVRSRKSWSDDSVSLLKVASSIFTSALENKRVQSDLQKAREELELRVAERTHALQHANLALQSEVEQRKQAEESMQISQALYLEVFDNSPMQIFVIDVLPDGHFRVLRTNPAHQRGSGLQPENVWGKLVEELVTPKMAESIYQHYRACINAGQPIEYEEKGPSPYWDVERIRTFRTTLAPVCNDQGEIVRLVGSSVDITDQKQAEKIVMDRAREEAVFNERSRLARELHDAVTQTLFSTTLTAEVLPKIWDRNPDEGRKKLEELRELTRGALAEMHTLLMELRPDAFAEAHLSDLLRHLVNAFIARTRIPALLLLDGHGELPLEVKVAFYRIAQEALNNIAKHSEASQVDLYFTCQPEQATLAVTDNGQGFDQGKVKTTDHYGLRIMQERAEQINALLQITSKTGEGTKINLRWQRKPAEA